MEAGHDAESKVWAHFVQEPGLCSWDSEAGEPVVLVQVGKEAGQGRVGGWCSWWTW